MRGEYSPVVKEEVSPGRQSISAGSPDLLDVGLEAPGHIVMHDGPDVPLVNAHPEGDCGHDNPQLAGHERVLDRLPLGAREPCVVRLRSAAQL